MKKSITTALALTFIVTSMNATGAEGLRQAVMVKAIKTEIQQTPQFSVSGIKDKRIDKPRYWFEVEAELEVKTNHPSGYIPEIQVQWYAVVQDKFHIEGNKRVKQPKLLSGTVTYQNVRTEGGTTYISAYIGPDTLEKMTGDNKPQERDVMAVALVISGPNIEPSDGLKKAIGVGSNKNWWEGSPFPKIEDAIVAKSKTPFAPLWVDRYPTEKEDK